MGHDVAARLRDGQAALDDLQKCVDACGLAGYRLIDVYGSEDGLDLIALDADADALRAAAVRADAAAELVRAQPGRLSEAWRGPAGEQAADLVGGHAAAAARLASAVRLAAEACTTLGLELWRIVDARVARTQTVAGAVRPEWLTGEIAGEELKAFAHNIILGEWTATMRRADDDARAVYRRAITTLDAAGPIGFAVPGPLSTGAPPAPAPTVPAPPPTVPASTAPPTIPAPVLPLLPTPQVPHASPIPLDTYGSGPLQPPVPPMSAPAALPSMPMPDLSGGPPTMPHFASEELGTPEKPVPESHGDSEKPETDKPEPDKPEPDKPEPDKPEPDKPESEPSPETPPDAAPELPVPPPEPAPVPAPQPAPEPEPSATPCEIAADQLPQVGS